MPSGPCWARTSEPWRSTQGALRLVNAFLDSSESEEIIRFDEQLDFWLFTSTHLLTIAACKAVPQTEYREIAALFARNCDVARDPFLHESLRLEFKRFLMDHLDCVEISHALSRAMIVFVICHEIAHLSQGHGSLPASSSQEDEAALNDSWYFLPAN